MRASRSSAMGLMVGSLASLASLGGFMGCSSATSSTDIVLPTEIVVRAEALTETQGCGTLASQVRRYAAVVSGCDARDASGGCTARVVLRAGVYDCFADATFADLPAVGGVYAYDVDVFLFDTAADAAARPQLDAASAQARGGDAAGAETTIRGASPTWKTTCTATQVDGTQTVATCAPLASTSPTSVSPSP